MPYVLFLKKKQSIKAKFEIVVYYIIGGALCVIREAVHSSSLSGETLSLGRFKPEPPRVKHSGASGHKTYPTAKEQPQNGKTEASLLSFTNRVNSGTLRIEL